MIRRHALMGSAGRRAASARKDALHVRQAQFAAFKAQVTALELSMGRLCSEAPRPPPPQRRASRPSPPRSPFRLSTSLS